MRERDSLLQALLLLKALDPRVNVNEIIAFLYVCENEGLSIQELAFVARLTQSTASRSVRALGPPDSEWALPPATGLLAPYLNPSDGRSHVLHLSDRGRDVRAKLDRIIRKAAPIGE